MNKKILIISLILFASFIYGNSSLITGSLLYINPEEPSFVFLDGEEVGHTPIFINNINSNTKLLELKNKFSYYAAQINYDNSISNVTRFSPVLEGYYGYLKINNFDNKQHKLEINGNGKDFDKKIKLYSGEYDIKVTREGYFPYIDNVVITENSLIDIDIKMIKSVNVKIKEKVPADSLLTFTNKDNKEDFTFTSLDNIVLYPGIWSLKATSSFYSDYVEEIEIPEDELLLSMDLKYYTPKIKIEGLLPGSVVTLNEVDVTEKIIIDELTANVGSNSIVVYKDKFSPIYKEVSLKGDELKNITINYQRDPISLKNERTKLSLGLGGPGALLLAGGLVLNSDQLAMDITNSYDEYKTMKLVSLGVAGIGSIMALTGTYFGFRVILGE